MTHPLPSLTLKKADIGSISALLDIERSVAGTKIYHPLVEAKEWEEVLKKENVFLIEKDGVAVGDLSYEQKGDGHVYISGLAIKPEFQGQGIARIVLTQILEKLKEVKRVDLVTHPENYRAIKLYESLGFVKEGIKENFYGDGEPRLMLAREK